MTADQVAALQVDDQFHGLRATQDDEGHWVIPEGEDAPTPCLVYTVVRASQLACLGYGTDGHVVNLARMTPAQLALFHLLADCPVAPPG